jgi:hypothetical protein
LFAEWLVEKETTERRRYIRFQLPSVTLVSLQGIGTANVYRCKDLGLGGMLLECLEPVPVGSVVRFVLQIKADTIRGVAAVRRVGSHEMGLAYTALKVEDRAKLKKFLDGLSAVSKAVCEGIGGRSGDWKVEIYQPPDYPALAVRIQGPRGLHWDWTLRETEQTPEFIRERIAQSIKVKLALQGNSH